MTDLNRTIRVGVVGTGQIGKWHLETYATKVNGVEVVAVCDINELEAQRVADKYKIPNVYTDFRQLLARDDIEAVDVALHNNLHRPVTVAALEAGKNVYCEKPMAGSYVDALAMYQTAQKLGHKLSIQLSTLFSKEIRAAKEIIDLGRLGKVYHARSTGFRRRGRPYVDGYGSPTFVQKGISAGGALYDMGVYHIASMLYLLGNPQVLRMSGKIYQETFIDPVRFHKSGYNVEELGAGFVRLANNVSLDVIESWAIHLDKFEGSVVVGSEGGIRLEPFGFFWNEGDLALSATGDLGDFSWRKGSIRENDDAYSGPQQHWIAALQGRVPLLPTAELALNTMLISEGFYLSEKLGREVSSDEVLDMSQSTMINL
jgi:predicted dehydrogenase